MTEIPIITTTSWTSRPRMYCRIATSREGHSLATRATTPSASPRMRRSISSARPCQSIRLLTPQTDVADQQNKTAASSWSIFCAFE